MYQRLDGGRWRHIWLVGDLHGCHQRLMQRYTRASLIRTRICWCAWGI